MSSYTTGYGGISGGYTMAAPTSSYTAPYWQRYGNAAVNLPATTPGGQRNIGTEWSMFGKRLVEEFGIRDIWDELARLDDDGMSFVGVLKNMLGVGDRPSVMLNLPKQYLTAPLQTVIAVPQELNRFAGALQLASPLATPQGSGLNIPGASTDMPLWDDDPLHNYLTGGMTPEEQEKIYAQSARGVYKPLTGGDLLVVNYDRAIKSGASRLLQNLGTLGFGWVGADNAGPLTNGSYLPASWDLRAADAGEQMENAGIYQSQRLTSNLATELMVDPLNWAAAPITGLVKARKGFTLIGDSDEVIAAMGGLGASDRVGLIGDTADLTNMLELDKVQRRLMHRPAGAGLWNQGRMLTALQGDAYAPMRQYLAETTDPEALRRFFTSSGMVEDGDEANRMARVVATLNDESDVVHFFNATTYRNRESIDILDTRVSDLSANLNDEFRRSLNLQDDMFERAALDFPEQGMVPKGHMLADNARSFLDEVLDDDDVAREAWEQLGQQAGGADEQARLLGMVTEQQGAMHSMNRLFGTRQTVTGTRTVEDSATGLGTVRFIPRPGRAQQFMRGPAESWMTGPRVYTTDGSRLSRYRPKIWMMDKPGLSFNLHGQDAIDKVNDLIKWVDGRIASQRYAGQAFVNVSGDVVQAGRFDIVHDPQLRDIYQRFLDAGVMAKAPENARKDAIDELQTLILQRMAESTGFDSDVAALLATHGMDRGRQLIDALTDADRGYTAAVVEDGRSQILTSQSAVERQGANFVPLMDYDSIFKALWAVRRGENAIGLDPAQIISKATMEEKYLGPRSQYAGRPLKYVGRERTAVGRTAHTMLDLADAVNHIFKVSVLLRLGYPVRNVAEGWASSMASGMSTVELARYLDFGSIVSNSLYNTARLPSRLIDRWKTSSGRVMNEDALIQMGDGTGQIDNIAQDAAHQFYATVANPETMTHLVNIISDSAAHSDEERAAASAALKFIVETKQRLGLAISYDNTALASPLRGLQSTHAAQHLYHADTGGTLQADRLWDPNGALTVTTDLNRPIRLVEDPTLAHANVNQQWTYVPTAGRTHTDRADVLRTNARRAGGGQVWRYTDRNGVQRQTTKAETVLSRADDTQPVTIHRVRAATATKPRMVYAGRAVTLPPPTIPQAVRGMRDTHHLQMRDNPAALWRPVHWPHVTRDTEIRGVDMATHPTEFPKVVSVDSWGREIDLTDQAGRDLALGLRGIEQRMIDEAQAGDHAMQDRLSDALARHGIYRMVLDDPSPNYAANQVIVHPRGVGQRGFNDAVRDEYNELIEGAARARSSEADLGVRRGRRGDTRSIGGLTRQQVKQLNRTRPDRTPAELREQMRRHWQVGQPVDPQTPRRVTQILQNGGFEHLANEVIEAAIRTRRDRYTVQALYRQRTAKSGRLAKRTGIAAHANRFQMLGAYGQDYDGSALLSGADGAVFRSLASGESSYMLGFTQQAYLSDRHQDLVHAMMTPSTVSPDDPRYFDALANLFTRQYRDQVGMQAGGIDNLDPMVRRLMEPGDRTRIMEEATDWALTTEAGRQWVRTLGLDVLPGRSPETELITAAQTQAARAPSPAARTRAERRIPDEIAIPRMQVGDLVSTMSNFLDNWVLASQEATDLLLAGNITGDALRAAHAAQPWELRPVHGLLTPTSAESRALIARQRASMQGMEELNHRIVTGMSKAMRTIGVVPETRMLRHPMFEAVGQSDLRQRIMLAENSLGRGLSPEEYNALRGKSQRFALKKISQTLYTLSGRSAVDDYARFISPFFPAWKNAATRWGKNVAESTGHVGLLTSRVGTFGRAMTIVDENGEYVDFNEANANDSYVVMPGLGGLLEKFSSVPGVASAMRNTYIPLRSLDVIFQGDLFPPLSGPWAAVPLQTLLTGHPEWLDNFAVKFLSDRVLPIGPTDTGSAGLDALTQFMPTSLRRAVDMATKNDAWASEYQRNLLLLMSLQQDGEIPVMSTDDMLEQGKRLTTMKMSVKLASALFSPVAQQQRGDVEFYASMWRQLRDAYGDTRMADDQFEKLFPTKYILTAQSSQNTTGGAATASTVMKQRQYTKLQEWAAETNTVNLLGFVENYDDDAFGLDLQTEFKQDDYNPYARRWQRLHAPEGSTKSFRQSLTPAEAARAAKVKDGYRVYDQTKALFETSLTQGGLAPGEYEFQKQLDMKMAIFTDNLGRDNPEWFDEHKERDENRLNRSEQFFSHVLDPQVGFLTPEREQHPLIQSMRYYLDTRSAIRNEMVRRKMSDDQAASTTTAQANADLSLALTQINTQLGQDSPAFRQWADRYFRNDVVSIGPADMAEALGIRKGA